LGFGEEVVGKIFLSGGAVLFLYFFFVFARRLDHCERRDGGRNVRKVLERAVLEGVDRVGKVTRVQRLLSFFVTFLLILALMISTK
jgi:hypothetical protein